MTNKKMTNKEADASAPGLYGTASAMPLNNTEGND
jgi:hypothetical protein